MHLELTVLIYILWSHRVTTAEEPLKYYHEWKKYQLFLCACRVSGTKLKEVQCWGRRSQWVQIFFEGAFVFHEMLKEYFLQCYPILIFSNVILTSESKNLDKSQKCITTVHLFRFCFYSDSDRRQRSISFLNVILFWYDNS